MLVVAERTAWWLRRRRRAGHEGNVGTGRRVNSQSPQCAGLHVRPGEGPGTSFEHHDGLSLDAIMGHRRKYYVAPMLDCCAYICFNCAYIGLLVAPTCIDAI